MLHIKEVIVVEGKYDKIKLSQITDAAIICTDGFQIYKNERMISFLKKMAEECGVILFTDSDSAGFRIRNFIKNKLSGSPIKHAYIPDCVGKEKRKAKPSKQGLLGVEGVSDEMIRDALLRCGATVIDCNSEEKKVLDSEAMNKTDFFYLGLSGGKNSKEKRNALLERLKLPSHMSANTLLDVLNSMLANGMLTKQDLFEMIVTDE